MDLAQHFPIDKIADLRAGQAEEVAKNGFVVFSRSMGEAARRKALLSQSNRGSCASHPTDLRMVDFASKATLPQVWVAV
jgi:hypothetical protein